MASKVSNVVLSASLMLVATNSIAAAASRGPLDLQTAQTQDVELATLIDGALDRRITREAVAGSFDVLVQNLRVDGRSVTDEFFTLSDDTQQPLGILLAQIDHARNPGIVSPSLTTGGSAPGGSGTGSCYSNCYSNCHSACHGSRGWR